MVDALEEISQLRPRIAPKEKGDHSHGYYRIQPQRNRLEGSFMRGLGESVLGQTARGDRGRSFRRIELPDDEIECPR